MCPGVTIVGADMLHSMNVHLTSHGSRPVHGSAGLPSLFNTLT